ncbi:MAG: hypothetical protein JNG89_20875 [Planctomycetaceae bacterium]|nr:hypothetical protein [Planctomycetaceae bacterium]
MDDIEFLPEAAPLPQRRRSVSLPQNGARTFQPRSSAALTGTLQCVGGALVIGFALVMFVIHLFIHSNQFVMHASTTLPILLGLGLLSAGISALRSPSLITVDAEGIELSGGRGSRRIAWSEIGVANANSSGLSQRRQLALCDTRGKSLVTIGDTFPDFGAFVKLVQSHVQKKPDNVAEPLRMKKARKTALLSAAFGVFMGVAAVGVAWNTWDTERGRQLLASDGVEGEARIVERFLAPNGVTCRLNYEVTGDGGKTATRNAEVERSYWNELEGATTVPVRYVPAEPGYSELLRGDVPSDDELGKGGYALSAAGAVMMLFGFGVALMQFKGYDYGTNPETGKVGFFKLGA